MAYNVYTKEVLKDTIYNDIYYSNFIDGFAYYSTINKEQQVEIHAVSQDLSENKILITSPNYTTSLMRYTNKYLITKEYDKKENCPYYNYYDRKTGEFIKSTKHNIVPNLSETIGFYYDNEKYVDFY